MDEQQPLDVGVCGDRGRLRRRGVDVGVTGLRGLEPGLVRQHLAPLCEPG